MNYYRRAWLWDISQQNWILFWNSELDTRFPPGLTAYHEPHPYIVEVWWYRQGNQWIKDGPSRMNWEPYFGPD